MGSGPLNVGGLGPSIEAQRGLIGIPGTHPAGEMVEATLAETVSLNPDHPASALASDPQVAASSLHFPSNVSDGQPWIKFTVEEFQGPKFMPNSRQPISSGPGELPSLETAREVATAGRGLVEGDTVVDETGRTWDVFGDGVFSPRGSSATSGTPSFDIIESKTIFQQNKKPNFSYVYLLLL